MAIIETNLDIDTSHQPLRIEQVGPRRRREGLSVLLTGERDPTDDAVDRFMKFMGQQRLRPDRLYAAYIHKDPLAAALVLPSAGRTGVLMCSPVCGDEMITITARVARHAMNQQAPKDQRLFQSLTDPGQRLERRALAQAGFADLATLVYMEREVPSDMEPPSVEATFQSGLKRHGMARPGDRHEPSLTALHWSTRHRDAFEHAVLESYANTLDCPGLLGLRPIEEVIDGHMATGKFDPKLWWAFYDGKHPVAVLLLARVPQRQAHELVYLGVSEPYRGLGLGSALVRLALHAVSKRGGDRIFLAVDQRNRPAVKLYRRFQFRVNAHKRAMIYSLEEKVRA